MNYLNLLDSNRTGLFIRDNKWFTLCLLLRFLIKG